MALYYQDKSATCNFVPIKWSHKLYDIKYNNNKNNK